MKTRTFLALGLLVCLLVAGVASFYASSHPDGLEYVAEKTGLERTHLYRKLKQLGVDLTRNKRAGL